MVLSVLVGGDRESAAVGECVSGASGLIALTEDEKLSADM